MDKIRQLPEAIKRRVDTGPGRIRIIGSRLSGGNVTAHGAKHTHAHPGKNVLAGSTPFSGEASSRFLLKTGKNRIIMPHTITDLAGPVTAEPTGPIWGLSKSRGMYPGVRGRAHPIAG